MSEIKVNKISPRTACGTVTLGDSGDTFTIPAGATITNNGTAAGFGATGAASWDTTVKTATFTAVSGVGYFVNTTAGAISVNLPAGTAGAVVAIKDYANTFDTNNCTLVQNGSDKIGGSTVNAILTTEGIAVTLVFIDSTQGWLVTDSGLQDEAPTASYVTATGGTITTSPCGDFKIHTFTGPGALCVSNAGNPAGSALVDYLVVAGGGGAGGSYSGNWGGAGGGGGGGYRESPGIASGSYSVSPLGVSPAVALAVPATSYPIAVGAGGAGSGTNSGTRGSLSVFSTIISTGGGGGISSAPSCTPACRPGGSGGGGSGPAGGAGTGNTPPVSPPQGNNGGTSPGPVGGPGYGKGGGGGATAVGAATNPPNGASGNGGAGATSSINETPTARAGGGGSGTGPGGGAGTGGSGGGGNGTSGGDGNNGTVNTGGGAGGAGGTGPSTPRTGGTGGSGIVVIRYKFQN